MSQQLYEFLKLVLCHIPPTHHLRALQEDFWSRVVKIQFDNLLSTFDKLLSVIKNWTMPRLKCGYNTQLFFHQITCQSEKKNNLKPQNLEVNQFLFSMLFF